MTKNELVALIMANTDEYKKSHLLEKKKAELEVIAAAFQQPEVTENETAEKPAAEAIPEAETTQPAEEAENGTDTEADAADEEPKTITKAEIITEPEIVTGNADELTADILSAYDENKKIVKGRRVDKDEFMDTVVEKTTARVLSEHIADPEAIKTLTLLIMQDLLGDLVAFCPMNDNERKMLETIPLLSDYKNTESQVNGKNFLQTVKELHNIEVSTSRALMVSLKRKKYITIEGGRKTYIILLERGLRHLRNVS